MMLSLIADSLDNITCSECHKYLSVKPIKTYPNGQIKCGRCSKQEDDGVDISEDISEDYLFKCINHYDGCTQLLTFLQVHDHEVTCTDSKYNCPICPETESMIILKLLNHFQNDHSNMVLYTPAFSIDLKSLPKLDRKYLYKENNSLFIIHLKFRLSEDLLLLAISYVGQYKPFKKIKQRFLLNWNDEDENRRVDTKSQSCTLLGTDDLNWFHIKASHLKINKLVVFEFETELYDDIDPPLSGTMTILEGCNCPNPKNVSKKLCRKLFIDPRFKKSYFESQVDSAGTSLDVGNEETVGVYPMSCYICSQILKYWFKTYSCISKKHFICTECYFAINKNDYIEFRSKYLSKLCHDLKYFCKWNCEKTFSYFDINKHELQCLMQQPRICPKKDCNFTATLDILEKHFCKDHTNSHLFLDQQPISLDLYLSNKSNIYTVQFYLLVSDIFVLLNILADESKCNCSFKICKQQHFHAGLEPIALLFRFCKSADTPFLGCFKNSFCIKDILGLNIKMIIN